MYVCMYTSWPDDEKGKDEGSFEGKNLDQCDAHEDENGTGQLK